MQLLLDNNHADVSFAGSAEKQGNKDTLYSQKRGSIQANKEVYKNANNVHQLYQDLFVTDMRDEMENAGKEFQMLRRELALKDHQLAQIRKQH